MNKIAALIIRIVEQESMKLLHFSLKIIGYQRIIDPVLVGIMSHISRSRIGLREGSGSCHIIAV